MSKIYIICSDWDSNEIEVFTDEKEAKERYIFLAGRVDNEMIEVTVIRGEKLCVSPIEVHWT